VGSAISLKRVQLSPDLPQEMIMEAALELALNKTMALLEGYSA